ncbi:hypothetical protein SAMN05518848_102106 [Paenibacillus sp. PDC88]|nr:hypothetical protein SAMN05518848_102106 [Paenibacillus sp. PDC88]
MNYDCEKCGKHNKDILEQVNHIINGCETAKTKEDTTNAKSN